MNMAYEIVAFFVVCCVCLLLIATRRCFQWAVSLRALLWCGAFSYIALLILPQVVVWPSSETAILLAFIGVVAALLAWIMAYHGF